MDRLACEHESTTFASNEFDRDFDDTRFVKEITEAAVMAAMAHGSEAETKLGNAS